MKLTVLGCGDAFGNGGRFNTSFLLTEQSEHVLIDCGASTLIRLKQEGILLNEISTIIVSHFHGDHYGGIPFFLISSLFESQRKEPLNIIGPSGIESKVLNLQEIMYEGTSEFLSSMDIIFLEFDAGKTIDFDNKSLLSVEVEHSPPSKPHGFRLEWGEKAFAFSGDTSWTDHLLEISKGADLFICECNFMEHQAYGHLCYHELKGKRNQIECDNIWLSHMGPEVLGSDEIEFNKLSDGLQIEF